MFQLYLIVYIMSGEEIRLNSIRLRTRMKCACLKVSLPPSRRGEDASVAAHLVEGSKASQNFPGLHGQTTEKAVSRTIKLQSKKDQAYGMCIYCYRCKMNKPLKKAYHRCKSHNSSTRVERRFPSGSTCLKVWGRVCMKAH